MKWISNIITSLLFILLISTALMVTVTKLSGGEPEVFGYQLKTVLSGSMEPDIQTGSIIAVKPGGDMTRFVEDDVITFLSEDEKIITHRIIDVSESDNQMLYYTKGDNNNAPDSNPVLSDNVIGVYSGITIPYLGYIVHFSQSQNGAFLLLIPGIMLLIYSGFTIWKVLVSIEEDQNQKKESPNEHTISS